MCCASDCLERDFDFLVVAANEVCEISKSLWGGSGHARRPMPSLATYEGVVYVDKGCLMSTIVNIKCLPLYFFLFTRHENTNTQNKLFTGEQSNSIYHTHQIIIMKSVVSIHAKYKFPSKDQEAPVVIEKKFDEGNCQIARLGLPDGVEAVKVCTCTCT